MKSTPITVYSGLAYIDEECIEVVKDNAPVDLSGYDIKFQLRDIDQSRALIESVPLVATGDGLNLVWPEISDATTESMVGKNVSWMAVVRLKGATSGARLIGFGPVRIELVAPVGEDVWQ